MIIVLIKIILAIISIMYSVKLARAFGRGTAPDNNGLISVETTTDGGICTVRLLNVPRYGGVTLSATVTNGTESRSICLATDIRVGENSISWDPQV